jgi:hypothetical protein
VKYKALRFLIGRNVLVDYYVYRESIELSSFIGLTVLEDVFEGGLEGMDGEHYLGRLFGEAASLVGSSSDPILIKKVGRCCYVRSSVQVAKHCWKLYEGATGMDA